MSESTRTFIKHMQPNQLIEGLFTIQNCQLGLTRNGKPYLKCLLADKTGRAPGRMWSASEELVNSLPHDGFVRMTGQTQPYQGELQIIIQQIEPARPTHEELVDLLPSTQFSIEQMYNEVRQILGTMSSPALRHLAEAYLNDKDLMRKFIQAPAAMTLHHAFLGGLLEHTLAVLKLAQATLPLYDKLNRDIVLMGVFLHDLGKCEELYWDQGFGYTDDGQLLGHIGRGMLILQAKVDACAADGKPIPTAAVQVLHHIILTHHGKPEFGAMKPPSTPEALFISLIDNVDAKMHMAIEAARSDGAPAPDDLRGNFTEKLWALENTRMYRPDPLADEAADPA
jgi:3'-5' exoribonuclease